MQLRTAVLGIILVGLAAGCDSKSDLCVPACQGRQCGLDARCGASCGTCPSDETCDAEGLCRPTCTPDCAGKECGDDGCQGSCGECGVGEQCNAPGLCETVEVPCCEGRVCGLDPCFAMSCGSCPDGTACSVEGQCLPTDQPAGYPCAFGEVNADAGDCLTGLMCLGLGPDPETAPCPNGDSDCSAYTDPGLNPDCVEGGCGASFCSARCAPDGACEAGFTPQDLGGACYCVPSPQPCGNIYPGNPCAFEGVVNMDAGPCVCDLTCLGALTDPQGPACADDVDCRSALGEIYNPECVGGRCGTSYCVTTCHEGVCDSGFEPQDFEGVCYCVPGLPTGSQDLGDPCTYGLVNEGAGTCLAGLGCIGMAPDPVNAPCPNGDADCAAFMDAQWNAECVNGGCGASLCAARCVDGACPDCGPAVTVSGECYCGLMGSVDFADREAGEACVWDVVNQDPCIGNCEASLNCLGMAPDPVGMPCAADADCLAFLPESWNPDCVEGGCGASFCSALCVSGQCQPGYGPYEISGNCYCLPAASDTPRGAGEACTFGPVNLLAGLCAEGLACAGVLSEEGAAPCPNGDADCLAFYDAGWNPDCTGGRCGASFCAVPCTGGVCEAGFTPVDVGGTCTCRASK